MQINEEIQLNSSSKAPPSHETRLLLHPAGNIVNLIINTTEDFAMKISNVST